MPYGQSRGATREPAVGEQGTGLTQALGFQVTGGVEHFLHARSTARSLVTDNHHVARLYTVIQNVVYGTFLAFTDMGRARKYMNALIDTRGLDHAAVLGDVAK